MFVHVYSIYNMSRDIRGIIPRDLAETIRGQPLSLLLIMFIWTPVLVTFFCLFY